MLRRLIASLLMLPVGLGLAGDWQIIKPGLSYRNISPHLISTTASSVYAFRLDLSKYQLKLLSAKQFGMDAAYANQFAQKSGALLAINGGFFSPEHKPLGLRLQNGKVTNPLKRISWWGVFYVKNNKAHVVAMKNFQKQNGISFAVQSGPRLLVNGKKMKLLPGNDLRSALCVDQQNRVIIAATNNLALTTTEFATILQQFGCVSALNLDGGSSTQLYVDAGNFSLNIVSFRPVADAVGVFAKN